MRNREIARANDALCATIEHDVPHAVERAVGASAFSTETLAEDLIDEKPPAPADALDTRALMTEIVVFGKWHPKPSCGPQKIGRARGVKACSANTLECKATTQRDRGFMLPWLHHLLQSIVVGGCQLSAEPELSQNKGLKRPRLTSESEISPASATVNSLRNRSADASLSNASTRRS